VDFENSFIQVRGSVVLMVSGMRTTEASAKDVPLDAALAESLLKLKLAKPYNQDRDWVFASVTMKWKQSLWPETLWRRYGPPASSHGLPGRTGISRIKTFGKFEACHLKRAPH
jgi:hypothetical protein